MPSKRRREIQRRQEKKTWRREEDEGVFVCVCGGVYRLLIQTERGTEKVKRERSE